MAAGNGLTVSIAAEEQPAPPAVYTTCVVPAAAPVTKPVDTPTVATDGSVILHVPPAVALLSKVVPPASQRVSVPLTGITDAGTVMLRIA